MNHSAALIFALLALFVPQISHALDPVVSERHQYELTTVQFPSPGPVANSPTDVAMAYDPVAKKVLLFGGADLATSSILGGAMVMDTNLNTLTKPAFANPKPRFGQLLTATTPSARKSARMAYSSFDGKIYLFGGLGTALRGDLWEIDLRAATPNWAPTTVVSGPAPAARFEHMMAYFVQPGTNLPFLVVVGGEGAGSGLLSDTWLFNLTTHTWTQVTSGLPTLSRAGLAWDPSTGQLVLVGGTQAPQNGNGIPMNPTTFLWNGALPSGGAPVWTAASITSPLPRQNLTVTYDGFRKKIVAFGGSVTVPGNPPSVPSVPQLELFEFSPFPVGGQTGWIDKMGSPGIDPVLHYFGSTSLGQRERASMVYVENRRTLMIIGGNYKDVIEFHPAPSTIVSPNATSYSGGCRIGGSGTHTVTFDTLPAIGQVSVLRLTFTNVAPNQPGAVLFGPLFAPTTPGGTDTYRYVPITCPTNHPCLPTSSCQQWVDNQSPDTHSGPSFATLGASQTLSYAFLVPDNPDGLGAIYNFQAWFGDPNFQPNFPNTNPTMTSIRTSDVPAVRLGH